MSKLKERTIHNTSANRDWKEAKIITAREDQLRVKPNPDYVADGVTDVLEYCFNGHNRIKNGLAYILVNDKKELKKIADNIEF